MNTGVIKMYGTIIDKKWEWMMVIIGNDLYQWSF